MITVYHSKELVMPWATEDEKPKFPADYNKIATLNLDDVDEGFDKSNSIMRPWLKNPEVKELFVLQARSTSVGDVLEVNGTFYRCESMGWSVITPTK